MLDNTSWDSIYDKINLIQEAIIKRETELLTHILTRWLGYTPKVYNFTRSSKITFEQSKFNFNIINEYDFWYEQTLLGRIIIHNYSKNFLIEFIPSKLFTIVMNN